MLARYMQITFLAKQPTTGGEAKTQPKNKPNQIKHYG